MVRAVALCVMLLVTVSAVLTHAHDLKYPEREVVAELAAQILRILRGPLMVDSLPAQIHTKRNSELINSLLGIPKVMNDAGRR